MKTKNTSNLVAALLTVAAVLCGTSKGLAQTLGPVPAGVDYTLPNYANSPIPSWSGLAGVKVTFGGYTYTTPPTVTIDPPPGGTAPTAVATLDPVTGAVTAITLTSQGSGVYTTLPYVTITSVATDPTGWGATAMALPPATISGGIRKFINSLPGLGASGTNNIGQYIPVAVPTKWVNTKGQVTNDDYYEIAVVQYQERMHSDLPGTTTLRGYVQLSTQAVPGAQVPLSYPDGSPILINGVQAKGVDKPHYMGPMILANKGTPVRIKFYNLLPLGTAGNLDLPVDTTIMGAGMGPTDMPGMPGMKESYTQNRANIHLHGGLTPWISDGTPHQWVVPAGETTSYKQGVSTQPVPDMPFPPPGCMTYYFPNQQSSRLMFYHDHSYGITRLNVYGGAAAGYLLTDPAETSLVSQGTLPSVQIPLIIQDKAFVWSDPSKPGRDTFATDPLWASAVPASKPGDLWFPHVYMPNQNPNDPMGANALGRWDWGPWFWPPQTPASLLPMPVVSAVPEGYVDTPVINGTAYPYVNVPAAKVRLRILNACNDRMLNLQLYQADPAGNKAVDPATGTPTTWGTEVAMVPAYPDPTIPFPASWKQGTPGMTPDILDSRPSGVPDPRLRGPAIVQIGTECGFLPAPAVLPNTPVGYEQNKRNIVVLNVSEKTLFMGPAERADVIVDFSKYAGKTVILYNDGPAPVPANDPRNDYYTNDYDFSSTGGANYQGGAPTTIPGYGPNTRTIMQFRVAGTDSGKPAPVDDYDQRYVATTLALGLKTAFAAGDQLIVPPNTYARIQDTSMTFTPIGSATSGTVPFQPKCIQELFDDYGRMNALLGVEVPFTNFLTQTTIPYKFIDPPTETLKPGQTQIWKITHNGVDTHAIHFHLFNVQVVNRVGWDGMIRPPDPNETGWKETVRMNPLEDVIVAMKPVIPSLPFPVPDSYRLLDPTSPVDSTGQFTGVDPNNNPVAVTNIKTNFGWEYVWHCHLLGHEENDMMRPMVMQLPVPTAPANLVATASAPSVSAPTVALTWVDTSVGSATPATGFVIQRALDAGFTTGVTNITVPAATPTAFTDTTVAVSTTYFYMVGASNGVSLSPYSNTATAGTPGLLPAAPTNLKATTVTSSYVILGWTNNANNAQGFYIDRSSNGGATWTRVAQVSANTTTFRNAGLTTKTSYRYRVQAYNAAGVSGFSNILPVTTL